MTNHVNDDPSREKADEMDVHLVSRCFVKQYYWILNERTHLLHQFYGSGSSVVMSESMGAGVKPYQVAANTTEEIYNLLNHMFRDMTVTLTELLPQRSMGGSVMVMVTGRMSQERWTEERCFTQVFLLARQESGFYIRTDTLQVHNPSETSQMLKGLKLKLPASESTDEKEVVEDESPIVETVVEPEPVPEVVEEKEEDEVVEEPPMAETATMHLDEEVAAPMPAAVQMRQLPEADPITEPEEVSHQPEPAPAPKPSPMPAKAEAPAPRSSGGKKSFLEAALSGAKRAPPPPKPVMERSNPKAAIPSGEGLEKSTVEGETAQPAIGRRSGGGTNSTAAEAEGKSQRQKAPRRQRNPSNKPGAEEGLEGNAGTGRGGGGGRGGRGAQGRGAGQGRGGAGRGPRTPKNPNSDAPGQTQAKNEDRSQRTVFVGQLPFGLKTETIHSAFCTFGPLDGGVDSISVKAGPNHAFAFVVFEDAASAKKALEGNVRLNGEELAIKPYAPRDRPAAKDRAGPAGGRRGGYQGRGGGNGGRYGTPNGNGAITANGSAPHGDAPGRKEGKDHHTQQDGGNRPGSFAGKEAGGARGGQMKRGGGGGMGRNSEMRRGGGQFGGNGGRGPSAQRLVHAGV